MKTRCYASAWVPSGNFWPPLYLHVGVHVRVHWCAWASELKFYDDCVVGGGRDASECMRIYMFTVCMCVSVCVPEVSVSFNLKRSTSILKICRWPSLLEGNKCFCLQFRPHFMRNPPGDWTSAEGDNWLRNTIPLMETVPEWNSSTNTNILTNKIPSTNSGH